MSLLDEHKEKIVAKLTNARSELEDALVFATHTALYGPGLVSETTRARWASIITELDRFARELEEP